MKIQCPNCETVHNISESKIPDKGAYAKCRECKTRFFIEKKNSSTTKLDQNEVSQKNIEKEEECLNCGFVRKQTDDSCPKCGIIYKKYEKKRECPNSRCKADRNLKNKKCPKCGIYYEEAEKSLNKHKREGVLDPAIQKSKHTKNFCESHLNPGEKILAWSDGYIGEMMGTGDDKQHNGVLIVTGERVVFYRKGLLGEVLETMPLNKITSIERKSLMGHRTIKMHTSNDELSFKSFDKENETKLVNAIEAGRASKDIGEKIPNAQQNDPMEALKKLGELKEMGILTEEEFQEKKAVLLSRL